MFFSYSDQKIIEMISQGDKSRNEAWKYIYNHWKSAYSKKILINGGTSLDIDELFSEICIKFENRILNKSLPAIENLKSYFAKCMYFSWINSQKMKSNSPFTNFEENLDYFDAEIYDLEKEKEISIILDAVLSQLSERCKKLLLLFANKVPMKDAAKILSLKDDQKAKKEKYECMSKLKAYVSSNNALENHIKSLIYG